jgi:hypothetical protein
MSLTLPSEHTLERDTFLAFIFTLWFVLVAADALPVMALAHTFALPLILVANGLLDSIDAFASVTTYTYIHRVSW